MIMMVAECQGPKAIAKIQPLGWGRMFVEKKPCPYDGEEWGFDNAAWLADVRGSEWDEDLYQRRLDAAYKVGTPLVAVTPDIVAGGEDSLYRSLIWREKLPDDWPWYLPVQDGMTVGLVEPHLYAFAGIFLGGSDRFKQTEAWVWAEVARANGIKFHYGRCGTTSKWIHARRIGADSCDSSTPMRENRRYKIMSRFWLQLDRQSDLSFKG